MDQRDAIVRTRPQIPSFVRLEVPRVFRWGPCFSGDDVRDISVLLNKEDPMAGSSDRIRRLKGVLGWVHPNGRIDLSVLEGYAFPLFLDPSFYGERGQAVAFFGIDISSGITAQ